MRIDIGNKIIVLSADELDPDKWKQTLEELGEDAPAKKPELSPLPIPLPLDAVPKPGIPKFDTSESTEIEDVPEIETQEPASEKDEGMPGHPSDVPNTSLNFAPGFMTGLSEEDIIALYDSPHAKQEAIDKFETIKTNPMSYINNLGDSNLKKRFYDPITAWVLDNEVMENPERIIKYFEQHNRRQDQVFDPWVHQGIRYLVDNDPLALLGAERAWGSPRSGAAMNKVVTIMGGFLPRLFKTISGKFADKDGDVFANDFNNQQRFQALGRKIGLNAKADAKDEISRDMFLNNVFDTLTKGRKLEEDKLRESRKKLSSFLKSRGPSPSEEDMRKAKEFNTIIRKRQGAIQGWKQGVAAIYRSLTGEEVHNRKAVLKVLLKVANSLDAKGEFELASEIDVFIKSKLLN